MLTPLERDRFIADCVELASKLGANSVACSLVASLTPSILGELRRRGWDVINLNVSQHPSLDEALNSGDGSYKP